MPTLIDVILAMCAVSAAPTTELQYAVTFSRVDRSGEKLEVKDFEVTFLDSSDDGNVHNVLFLTSESGANAVAWPERFGTITNQFDPAQEAGSSAQVLYRYEERAHLLSIPDPVFEHRAELAEAAEWSTAANRYRVVGQPQIADRPHWEVEIDSTRRGGAMTVIVDPESGLIRSGKRKVTLGQGVPFELSWELLTSRELSADEATRTAEAAEGLLKLQTSLEREEDGAQTVLSPAQLDATAAVIDSLQQQSADTPFAPLVKFIARDLRDQRERADSVAELAKKFVGQSAPEFLLTAPDGKPLDAQSYKGKTLVLHFWDYKDEPLEEPYGQIGYLDFLLNRHPSETLAVYGVAVDRRLQDPATSGAAARSIRRLKSFMNLGYDIAADRDGKLLKAFGDPTRFDAALPLWVVIGPDGKVAHYRTGYYEIDRELGLAEIDAIVSELSN